MASAGIVASIKVASAGRSDTFSFGDLDTIEQGAGGSDTTSPLASLDYSPLAYHWQAALDGSPSGSSASAPENAASGGSTSGSNGSGSAPSEVATSGSGLIFFNTYTSDDTVAFDDCIVAAEKQLEGIFTSSLTLHVNFNMQDVAPTTSNPNPYALSNNGNGHYLNVSYATLKAALLKVAPSDVLPSTDPSGGAGFQISNAYARFLGLSTTTETTDVNLTLNTYYSWDFGQDVINGITHELTENGMGRVSGLGDQNGIWSTMDLFRYTAATSTTPGTYDTTDGRDGKTTYFSSDGGDITSNKGVPSLSFANEYSGSTYEGGFDPDDWNQQAVFGSTGKGEEFTMVQTELEVMQALGWQTNLQQQFFTASSGLWETPTSWFNGYNPITVEDAAIGVLNAAAATLDGNSGGSLNSTVTVNSIATNTLSSLQIGDDATFIATNGTVLNSADTYSLYSGNLGTIVVDTLSTMEIGNTFDNAGALDVGKGAGGTGYLEMIGTVTLDGSGKVTLGENGTFGDITSAPSANGGLINVNNTIAGVGLIGLASFDNQAGGTVEATEVAGSPLQIIANTFTNEGLMVAEKNCELQLGSDGGTDSLTNAGAIQLESQSDLAISGTFTIAGTGSIAMKGAVGYITSDGDAAATLVNESTIESLGEGQIGDSDFFSSGANDLTFENSGTAAVDGGGDDLVINTGANIVYDGGGTLGAENGGHLTIDSAVHTGVVFSLSAVAGTIEATSGGVVTLGAAVTDGISLPLRSKSGEVLIEGGTVELMLDGSVAVPIVFSGGGGTLEDHFATTAVSSIAGLQVDDSLLLTGTAVSLVTIGASSIVANTNSTNYTFGNVTYTGTVNGYVAWNDIASGLERITFTDGNVTNLTESGWTIYEGNAQVSVTGSDDTVYFQGGSGDQATFAGTAGKWDTTRGSNAVVTLNDAQASVFGSDDTIDLTGTTGNQVSLYSTSGKWDTINGSSAIVYMTDAQASVFGGLDTIYLLGGAGNQVSLYNTGANWDSVSGSSGIIYVSDARTSVTGGGDSINVLSTPGSNNQVSLYGTAADWDGVSGSSAIVYLTNAQTSITGGGDTIDFEGSAGNQASLYGTAGNWDVVNGASGILYLTDAQTSVFGGGDSVNFEGSSGNQASLYNTGGTWDGVSGSNGIVYLTDAQASITGGTDTINFEGSTGNQASLYGTAGNWDAITGSSGLAYFTNAQASVYGGGDTLDFEGSTGNQASLYNTGSAYDTVNGSHGVVYLTDAQAVVAGGLDTIDLDGTTGNIATLDATAGVWDTVNGSDANISLNSAQASIIGGGNVIAFAGGTGNIASLGGTTSGGDTVNGNGGVVDLYSVTAKVTGTGDTLNFNGSDTLNITASPDLLVFGHGIGGADLIKGAASTDNYQFSKLDFANFAALMADTKQSGANTVITLNASDTVTLLGVTASTLQSSQFTFV